MGQHSSSRSGAAGAFSRRRALLLFAAAVALALLSHDLLTLARDARESRAGFAGAKWIWFSGSPERGPARFTARASVSLSKPPGRAVAHVFIDRRYTLWVNGVLAATGGHTPGDTASRVDVASLLRAGGNVVSVLAESPDGMGGLLFALDCGPGSPVLVSDASWSIEPDGPGGGSRHPRAAVVLGKPPLAPWGWDALEDHRGSTPSPDRH
ncbi:MAG: hypothetical protein ABJC07_05370 [Acidobacteriota bacterium]